MNTQILVDDKWVDGVPGENEWYRKEVADGVWQECRNTVKTEKPKITFNNITLTSSEAIGDYFGIKTLPQYTDFKIEADIVDPSGLLDGISSMNIIIEKVVNQSSVVADERFNASISNGKVIIDSVDGFESTGNYMFTAKRQNDGLKYLGLNFEIEFDTIEFDIQRS